MAKKTFDAAAIDFCQSVGLLVRKARSVAVSDELSWTEMAVLRRLSKDGPATTAELARAQGMKPQSMRTIIGVLEELRMVERRPHATDGRQVNLELTAKGAAAQKLAGDAKRTWVVDAIAQLSSAEQQTLFAAGEIIRKLIDEERS